MKSSIGFHTFTIFIRISWEEAMKLFEDFQVYRDTTKEVKMYIPSHELERIDIAKKLKSKGISVPTKPREWRIDYISDDRKGINWILRFINNKHVSGFYVETRINPKILAGIRDYLTASNSSYLKIVEKRFNEETGKISDILREFSFYKLSRVDFCINFDLKEMGIPCTPKQMIELIKKGDYPSYFDEHLINDIKAKKKKRPKYSFYLRSGATNINCYYKYMQLQHNDPNNPNLEDSLNVIRFEVQCKYRKLYNMRQIIDKERVSGDLITATSKILSNITAQNMIEKYYNQIIRPGDYYPLKRAIEIIEDQDFKPDKEYVLTETLKEINRTGIAKFRSELNHAGRQQFYRTLDTLAELKINPVTIPKSYGVKHIPNLLDTFNRLRESGVLGNNSLVDPFDPLERPFEESIGYVDSDNIDEDTDSLYDKDSDDDSESEYEETFVFKWELQQD